MEYQWKKSKPVFPVMPPDKREGVVPAHGYCSGKPAVKYGEAMQMGNGRMSVSVYGDPYREQIIYGHERLYFATFDQVPSPPPLAEDMGKIRELLLEGKNFEAADLASDIARKKGEYQGLLLKPERPEEWEKPIEGFVRHSGARLTIAMDAGKNMRDYLRSLDFIRGESAVYWTDEDGSWVRKGFVSRPDSVFLQKILIPEGKAAQFRLEMDSFTEEGEHEWERMSLPGEVKYTTGASADGLFFRGWYESGISREGYAVLVWVGGKETETSIVQNRLLVKARGEVEIRSSIRHYEVFTQECGREVLRELAGYGMSYEEAMEKNLNSHGRLMRESMVELECECSRCMTMEELLRDQHLRNEINPYLLEKYYDAGRYFQIINTGELPPMIGQWNINVNLQVCGGNMTGLQELMIPYFRFIEKNIEDFRINAREIYGCAGIVADIHPDMDNGLLYHFSRTWPHEFYTAGAGWMYHEFYYYYLTTGDRRFLENHVVPGLKEIALFYGDFLRDRDEYGNYIFYPCLSPENNPSGRGPASVNAVMDIMVCREVLENLLRAEEILGIKDQQRDRWEDILEHLPVLLLDEEGGLKEWAWPEYEENYNHRCVSHHYDVWPADKINWEETPDLARAVWISNRKRPLENDSCHGIMHRLFTAIRLRDFTYAERLIHMLLEAGFINSNMSTNHYPYRVVFPDMLGSMPAVVGELLVCSKPGRIRFLPAAGRILPAGCVWGMRLYTLVLLERMEWDSEKFCAGLSFMEEQKVEIEFGKKIRSCSVNGKPAGMTDGKLLISGIKGERIKLEALFDNDRCGGTEKFVVQ